MALTKRNLKLIGFASVGVIAIGGFFVVVSPILNQQSIQASEMEDANAKVEQLQAQLSGLGTVEQNFPAVEKVSNDLSAKFPALADVPQLLNTISTAAVNAGIPADKISNIEFGVPTLVAAPAAADAGAGAEAPVGETGDAGADAEAAAASEAGTDAAPAAGADAAAAPASKMATMDISLGITGTPRQLEAFLSNLYSADRVLLVSGVSLASAATEGAADAKTLSLTGKTFLYGKILTPEELLAANAAETPADAGTTDGTTPAPSSSDAPTE